MTDTCTHATWTGAEGPADVLGRNVLLWRCDGCRILGVLSGEAIIPTGLRMVHGERAAKIAREVLEAAPDARGEPCDVVLQAHRAIELAAIIERETRAPELVLDGGYGAIPTPDPDFYDLARAEELRANEAHPLFSSLHEGYAVVLEEVDELWELVRMKASKRDPLDVLEELVQIAAMAGKAARSARVLPGSDPF